MHVGIITYQRGHLKTWQIVKKLLVKPFNITLFAFPFISRPQEKRGFQDRPYQLLDGDIKSFCKEHGIGYVEVDGYSDKDALQLGKKGIQGAPDVYLTCIAKIIPHSFITDRIIINAHPGLLPENRGLDAFKWAVINAWPIGISLHAIDEGIDKGILLCRKRVPILAQDTLSSVASRAYEMECDLQVNFDYYLNELRHNRKITDKYPLSKKRVPDELDRQLEDIFLKQRERFIELSNEKDSINSLLEENNFSIYSEIA